jgi:DNA-binding beta-propeller fold protein YncE
MMTRNNARDRFGVVCAIAFVGAALAGCSGSSGGGGTGGGGNVYPSSIIAGAGTLVDPSHVLKLANGDIAISDMAGADVVKIYDSAGNLVKTIGGTPGVQSTAPGEFDAPEGMTIAPNGNLYVVDSDNHRVEVFDQNGNFLSQFTDAGLQDPEDVTVDSAGNAYIVDDLANKVFVFNAAGALTSSFGDTGSFILNQPLGIALDGSGHLVVADSGNNRMVVYSTSGTAIGAFGSTGSGNGQFLHPVGICFDSHGNFYVNDAGNGRVVELDVNNHFVFNYQYRDPKSVSLGQKTSLEGFGVYVDAGGTVYVVMAGTTYVLAPHP